jgi:hypothetical protein
MSSILKIDRREAIREYKARNPLRGVFAVRCKATGQVWVGSSGHLDTMRNSIWFTLRSGIHADKALQSDWNTHGEQTFGYEILEEIGDDVPSVGMGDLLKEMKARWASRFDAHSLL